MRSDLTMQPDTMTLNITVLWLLISTPFNNAWIVRRSKNLNLDRYAVGLVGFKGLMAAIVFQAWVEASGGDPEAMEWLAGDDCFNHCFVIGFNHAIIINWVKKTRKEWQKMDNKVIELRQKIADQKGLPGIFAEWLRGENEAAIRKDAEKLIKWIKPETLDVNKVLQNRQN